MHEPSTPPAESAGLRRALGRWDLTAFGVNIVFGGAIFLTPSLIIGHLGTWAPVIAFVTGLAVFCIALCYAEVGSRFDATGGPYLYTLAAFGKFVAFEVGWMTWFTRVSSQAALVNGIALAIGFYAPAANAGLTRVVLILGIFLLIGFINWRGIRESALVINTLVIAKLAVLGTFIVVGLGFVDWERVVAPSSLNATDLAAGALLIIYAYGGFETTGIPSGESHDPRRHLPFALVTIMVGIMLITALAYIVVLGTTTGIASSRTPVADAALGFMGPAGALMIGIGSIVSITGNVPGSILAGSRVLFALGENGAIPRFFAQVHARFRTPGNAIWFSVVVAVALALTGSFAVLALASVVARLLTYIGVSAATLALRREKFAGQVPPALFVVPFGRTIPLIAIAVALLLVASATGPQLIAGGIALAAGAILFALTAWRRTLGNAQG